MNRSFLKIMIVVVGLQSMVIMPSDMAYFDDDAQEQEVHGVLIDPERDESFVDLSSGQQEEGRTTQIEIDTPLWDFKMITDSWFVQTVVGIVVFLVVYRWYNNDSTE